MLVKEIKEIRNTVKVLFFPVLDFSQRLETTKRLRHCTSLLSFPTDLERNVDRCYVYRPTEKVNNIQYLGPKAQT